MLRPFLLTLADDVTEDEVQNVAQELPSCVSALADMELRTLVVRFTENCNADAVNAAHALLARSGLFFGGPSSEEAVRRYGEPHLDRRPPSWAAWEGAADKWNIFCERCHWSAIHQTEAASDEGIERHDREVHGD